MNGLGVSVHFWVLSKVDDLIGTAKIQNLHERKKFCDLKKHSFFKAFQNKSPSSESPLISPQSSICSIETIGLFFFWHMSPHIDICQIDIFGLDKRFFWIFFQSWRWATVPKIAD